MFGFRDVRAGVRGNYMQFLPQMDESCRTARWPIGGRRDKIFNH